MTNEKIVGICLIKNEEYFIRQVLLNVLDFCDRLIIADNMSSDRTYSIVQEIADKHKRVECHRIHDRRQSQDYIASYIGTPTWIFAVDGDEIYDPEGLRSFRKDLLGGKYDQYERIYGNVLNCISLDREGGVATGYTTPACRSMTKLYNFWAIVGWKGDCVERLHGGELVYREGYGDGSAHNIFDVYDWDDSPFRCLHACLIPRSGLDKPAPDGLVTRLAGTDLGLMGVGERIRVNLLRWLGRPTRSAWKMEKYMRGDLVVKEVREFFPNGNFLDGGS